MNDHQTSYPLGGQVNESVEWGSLEAQPCSALTTWAIRLAGSEVRFPPVILYYGLMSCSLFLNTFPVPLHCADKQMNKKPIKLIDT